MIILDACQTAFQVKQKGGAPGPDVPIALEAQSAASGEVFLSSASPGEPAQEWDYLGGALFTHHLFAALRGAADFDDDGNITLTEAYSYAYRHTVVDAAQASSRPQRPSFDFRFRGFGDWVATQPGRLSAAILIERGLTGRFLVVDRENRLVVEVAKSDEQGMRVALRPGWYRIVHPGERTVSAVDVHLLRAGLTRPFDAKLRAMRSKRCECTAVFAVGSLTTQASSNREGTLPECIDSTPEAQARRPTVRSV